MDEPTLTNDQIAAAGLTDWHVLQGPLYTRYRTGTFAVGLQLVDAIGAVAEELNHHPDIDLRYGVVQIRLYSHDAHGRTERDLTLARRISAIAAGLGLSTDVGSMTLVEFAIDTWDAEEILPFWLAVFGVDRPEHGPEVWSPGGFLPTVWFQETDPHETPRQRWHSDVWVPVEQAKARVAAAIAAGGTIVADGAPRYVVLADPQGNRACICTSAGR